MEIERVLCPTFSEGFHVSLEQTNASSLSVSQNDTQAGKPVVKQIAIGAGGLGFDSRAGHIGHNIVNSSQPL